MINSISNSLNTPLTNNDFDEEISSGSESVPEEQTSGSEEEPEEIDSSESPEISEETFSYDELLSSIIDNQEIIIDNQETIIYNQGMVNHNLIYPTYLLIALFICCMTFLVIKFFKIFF